MVNLNSRLRRTLRVLIPHDGKRRLADYLDSGAADLHGLEPSDVLRYAQELEHMGLLEVEADRGEDGEIDDCTVHLSSEAASYFSDRPVEAAKTAFRYLFQLLVGASGGLVALLAQQLLAQ